MNNTQLKSLATQLIQGPKPGTDPVLFVRDALAAAQSILRQSDTIGGPRGQARFDDIMTRLEGTTFYSPTETSIPADQVGGAAGDAVEARHTAETERVRARNEQVIVDIGKAGAAATIALTTGNPAAAIPVLEVIGTHLLEALNETGTN